MREQLKVKQRQAISETPAKGGGGAYSYGRVGAARAQEYLAAPIEETLYFAGEATDTTGHNGTVHGAIASGYRAAKQILAAIE